MCKQLTQESFTPMERVKVLEQDKPIMKINKFFQGIYLLNILIILISSCESVSYSEHYDDGSIKLFCEQLSENRIKCHSYYENGIIKALSTVDGQGKLQGTEVVIV